LGGLEVDGIFGSKTKSAVMLFQQNHPPLDVDGIVGIFTREKLKN
jgi:peptidoglycan hydrolase-like protein with peptidoglycan-binding domain